MDEDDLPYCIETHCQVEVPEADGAQVRRVVSAILRAEGCAAAEISVALLDGPSVRELNARYLDRDEGTDVLAFDLTDDVGRDEEIAGSEVSRDSDHVIPLQGEVVVNVEMARRRAAERRIDPAAELMLYVAHGCLHLLGYDDTDPEQAAKMHRREDELLAQLGYGSVYASPDDSRQRDA